MRYNDAMFDVIGQDHAIEVLTAALADRMHHAWIFHGPAGVGKFTAAVDTARFLLCHEPATMLTGQREPCGDCESCRLFAAAPTGHPDLHIVAKELAADSNIAVLRSRKQMNIPVDLLREHVVGGWVGSGDNRKYFEPPVAKTPQMRHGKIFIIDEAELMDAHGQNALLKTLEEPPPNTYVFLITSHEDRLLQTIRSRCQRVGFARLTDDAMADWLAKRDEGAALGEAQRALVARFAQGSPGKAMMAIEYRLDAWQGELVPNVERALAGHPDAELGAEMAGRCEAFAKAWVEAHAGSSKDAANKAAVRLMLSMLGELCRAKLREAANAGMTPDTADAALAPWLSGIALIQQAEAQMAANVAVPLLMDNLAIQWTQAATQPV